MNIVKVEVRDPKDNSLLYHSLIDLDEVQAFAPLYRSTQIHDMVVYTKYVQEMRKGDKIKPEIVEIPHKPEE